MTASITRMPWTRAGVAEVVRQNTERPLSDRQHELRKAIAVLGTARREQEAAAEPVRRCEAVIAEVARLQAELNTLYQRDERASGEWIAGGRKGPDPDAAADTLALNNRIAGMQGEASAVRRVLPEKQAALQAAIAKMTAAQTALDLAVIAAALDEARAFANRVYLPAVQTMLDAEVKLRDLAEALLARGNAPGGRTVALPDYRNTQPGGRRARSWGC